MRTAAVLALGVLALTGSAQGSSSSRRVDIRSEDFFAGRDPVLAAALEGL